MISRIIKIEVGVISLKPRAEAVNFYRGLDYSGYHIKTKLIIVLLYIEQKWKTYFYFFTDGKQHKARELDVITRDLECPRHVYFNYNLHR